MKLQIYENVHSLLNTLGIKRAQSWLKFVKTGKFHDFCDFFAIFN